MDEQEGDMDENTTKEKREVTWGRQSRLRKD